MDIDKLQDLLTVASGFQSLIYNIKSGEKYAYDDLLRQLETVWKALKQTQNLSKLLVSNTSGVLENTQQQLATY